MEIKNATASFHALAGETRLKIFRHLVRQGPSGLAAGAISRVLSCPASTLSFHLKALCDTGLIKVRKQGRSLIYAVDFVVINQLISFLIEDCCGGVVCPELVPFGVKAP